MPKDPDLSHENKIAHEIMHMFQFSFRDKWVHQKVLFRSDRLWVKVFNDLVKQGMIVRKKTFSGFQYKWAGRFP